MTTTHVSPTFCKGEPIANAPLRRGNVEVKKINIRTGKNSQGARESRGNTRTLMSLLNIAIHKFGEARKDSLIEHFRRKTQTNKSL